MSALVQAVVVHHAAKNVEKWAEKDEGRECCVRNIMKIIACPCSCCFCFVFVIVRDVYFILICQAHKLLDSFKWFRIAVCNFCLTEEEEKEKLSELSYDMC